jgi:hypothetical protein
MSTTHVDYKKYIMVFFITAVLFFGGFYLNNFFNNKKIDQLKKIQDKISVDILSSETQFSLLSELSCQDVSNSILSQELSSLAEKLDYGERTIGANNPDIVALRRYYSLLEIKDYLLMKKVSDRCKTEFPSIIYFYSNVNCEDCGRQWETISALRNQYPEIRVYVFDYDSDLSAVRTLISMFKVPSTTPVIVVEDKVYTGFTTLNDLKALFPTVTAPIEETTTTSKKVTQ